MASNLLLGNGAPISAHISLAKARQAAMLCVNRARVYHLPQEGAVNILNNNAIHKDTQKAQNLLHFTFFDENNRMGQKVTFESL